MRSTPLLTILLTVMLAAPMGLSASDHSEASTYPVEPVLQTQSVESHNKTGGEQDVHQPVDTLINRSGPFIVVLLGIAGLIFIRRHVSEL